MGSSLVDVVVVQVALEGRAGVMVKRLWDVAAQGLPACGVPALDAEIQGQLWDHLVHRTPEVVFSYHESAPASPRSHEKSKHTSTPFWVMPEEPLSGDDPALESFEAAVDAGVKVTAQFHVWELAAGIGVEKTSKFPIPDSHLKIVEILARARHQGALQRDVARLVNLKPENLWAQLRQLETRGLLVKFPIAAVNTTQESNTVTTNILFLPTFAPRIRAGKAHRFMPASDGGEKVQYILNDQEAPLRDICELLERHNGGPVLEKTFKAELGYVKVEGNRAWRRVREKLVRDGYIELGSAPKPTTGNKRKDDSRQATIRLLRPFGPAADESDEDETGGRGPRYFATPGLERQMLDVIAAGGARGASGPEVWQTLGVSGKAAAKRLVAPLARLGIQTTVETVGRGRMQVFTMPERHRKAAATLNRASVRAASRALVGAPAHQQRHGSDIMQVSDASCDDEAAPPPTPPEERTPPRSASPAHDRSSSDAGVEHRLLTAARRAGAAPGPGPGPGPGPTAAAGRRRSRRAGGRRSFMELSDDERSSRGGDTSEDDFTPGKTSDESEESDVESDDLDSDGPPRRKRGRPPRQAGTEPHGGAAEGSGRFWKGSGAARPEEYVQRYNAAAAFLQTCPDGWTFRAELSRAVADATTGGKKARLDRKLMLRLIDDLERDGHAVQAHVRLASGKSSAAGEVHVVGAPGATMTEEIRMRLDKRLADLNSLVRRQGIKARRERNPHTDVVRLAAQEPGTGGEDEAGSAKDTIMMKLAETGYCMQLMLRAKMTHLQLCQAARLWAGGHADPSGVPGDDAAPHGAGVVGGRSPARPAQPRKVTGGFSMPGPMNIGAANPTATSPGNRAAQPARGVAQEEELGPYRVSIAGLIMQMKLGEFARVVGVHPHPNLDLQRDSEVVVSDLPVDVQRTILSGNNLRRLTRAMDILERLGLVRSAAVSRTPAPGAAPAAAPVQFYAPSTEGCIDVPESFDDEHGGGYLAHAAVGASSAPGVRRATFDLRVEAHVHDWWNLLYFLTLSDPVFAASHRPGATEPAVTSTRKWVAADRDEEVGAYRELMERFHEMDHAPTFAEVREAAAEVGVAHEKAIRIKFQVDREKRRKKNGRVDSLRRKESEVRASGRITRRQPEVAAYQSLLGKARQDGAGQGVREEDDAEVEQEEDGVEVARAEGGRTGRRKRSWGESEDLSWMTSLVRYYLATGDVKDKVPTRLMTPSEEHLKHSQISVRLRRIRTVEASCRAFQALRTACIWGFVEAVPQSVHAAAVRAVAEGRAPEECAGKESVEVLRARLTEAPVEEAATVAQDSAFQARLKVCREAVEAVLSGPVLAREDVQDQDHKLLAKQERLLAEVEKGLQMLTATRPRRVERIAQLLARLLTVAPNRPKTVKVAGGGARRGAGARADDAPSGTSSGSDNYEDEEEAVGRRALPVRQLVAQIRRLVGASPEARRRGAPAAGLVRKPTLPAVLAAEHLMSLVVHAHDCNAANVRSEIVEERFTLRERCEAFGLLRALGIVQDRPGPPRSLQMRALHVPQYFFTGPVPAPPPSVRVPAGAALRPAQVARKAAAEDAAAGVRSSAQDVLDVARAAADGCKVGQNYVAAGDPPRELFDVMEVAVLPMPRKRKGGVASGVDDDDDDDDDDNSDDEPRKPTPDEISAARTRLPGLLVAATVTVTRPNTSPHTRGAVPLATRPQVPEAPPAAQRDAEGADGEVETDDAALAGRKRRRSRGGGATPERPARRTRRTSAPRTASEGPGRPVSPSRRDAETDDAHVAALAYALGGDDEQAAALRAAAEARLGPDATAVLSLVRAHGTLGVSRSSIAAAVTGQFVPPEVPPIDDEIPTEEVAAEAEAAAQRSRDCLAAAAQIQESSADAEAAVEELLRAGLVRELPAYDTSLLAASEHSQRFVIMCPGTDRPRIMRPWVDHRGCTNVAMLDRLAKRVAALAVRHPGVSERVVGEEVQVLLPCALRELLNAMCAAKMLRVDVLPETRACRVGMGVRAPAMLLGVVPEGASERMAQGESEVDRRVYYADPQMCFDVARVVEVVERGCGTGSRAA